MNTSVASDQMPLIEQLYDELLVSVPKAGALKLLALMYDDDPDTIYLALRLITTGNESARKRVQTRIDEAIVNIAEAQYLQNDDTWKEQCKIDLSPRVKNSLIAGWHTAHVIDEVGSHSAQRDPSYYEREMNDLHRITFSNGDSDLSKDDSYWRGLAALALTELSKGGGGVQSAYYKRFVRYAGKQENLPRIIRLAAERRVLNPEALEGLMKEQDKNPTAVINDGVL